MWFQQKSSSLLGDYLHVGDIFLHLREVYNLSGDFSAVEPDSTMVINLANKKSCIYLVIIALVLANNATLF